MGVSEATLCTWKSKYGALEVSEARRLKHMVADRSLDKEGLRAVIQKTEIVSRRRDVALLIEQYRFSERQACKLLDVDRSSYRYQPKADSNDASLREELLKWLVRSRAIAIAGCTFCYAGTDSR